MKPWCRQCSVLRRCLEHEWPDREFSRETDGRWIADIPTYPGVMAYGATREEAEENVIKLLVAVRAERQSHGEE